MRNKGGRTRGRPGNDPAGRGAAWARAGAQPDRDGARRAKGHRRARHILRAVWGAAAEGRRRAYDRRRDLPGLLALWPGEITDLSLEGHRRIIARLESALRAERRRGQCGHWTYDLARHRALLRAYREERAALRARERREGRSRSA